jgi:hypothetical protein
MTVDLLEATKSGAEGFNAGVSAAAPIAGALESRAASSATALADSSRAPTGRMLSVDPEIDQMVERGIVEEAESSEALPQARPQPPASRGVAAVARARFKMLRDGFATRLGVGKTGQVHHAVELQVLDRYPGVYTETELNDFANMRGIPPELESRRQLHNAKIREIYDRHYGTLDAELISRGLKPGTGEYNSLVRRWLDDARKEIDYVLGQFFSEERAKSGLPG